MGPALKTSKRERLEVRVTPEQKALFQRAADVTGRSLSDFVISTLQRAAEEVIRSHQLMELTARDSQFLAGLLLNPPEPNEALLRYARRYRELRRA